MIRYLIGRLPSVLLVILATSIIAFLLPRMASGDPAYAIAGPDATEAQLSAIRASLGLDQNLFVQYFTWLGGLFRGNLGMSYVFHQPVAELIADRMGSTVQLAVTASILMIIIGVGLGFIGGSVRSPFARTAVDVTNTVLLAVPAFLTGLILIVIFGVMWKLLPVSGEMSVLANPSFGLQYLILPALALALSQAAGVARLLQTTMLSTRSEEFIDLARAKGASPRRVTMRHVLRNSFGAAIVAIGIRVGEVFGGAVIIEAIFARNGLGQLAVQAVNSRDYQLIQVLIVLAVVIAVLCQLLTEVILASLDPRVRLDV